MDPRHRPVRLYRWEQTGDEQAWDVMLKWFEDRFAAGTPTRTSTPCRFLTLANLYEQTGDQTYLPYLDIWAEWLMADDGLPKTEEGGFQHIVFNDENPQEMWDDTLMMSVLPLARIGQILNRPHYIEEAKRQFLVHIKYLFDRQTGLWYHGWTFDGRHNFAGALWARGNCWVTIAIPEIIEMLDLAEGDAFRTFLIDTLAAQVKTLAEHQDERAVAHANRRSDQLSRSLGDRRLRLWHPEGGAEGLSAAPLQAVGIKAIRAVLANIDEHGELKQVSFGTAMGDTMPSTRTSR
jgi:unsaturated rhamnogalacturonyl hydrolase